MTPLLLTGLTLALTAGLVVAERRQAARPRAILKSLASLGFLLVAVSLGLPGGSWAQQAVFVGLILGAAGDLFLLSRAKRWFLAGLVAFLLNHVGFLVAFFWVGVHPLWAGLAALPLVGVAYAVWRWLSSAPDGLGSLAGPVVAYIAVISAMVAASVGTLAVAPVPAGPTLVVAAVLFFVSDLCVARDRFVAPGPDNRTLGLPLYYAGQLTFAWGASFLV
jgi:uncharacterized membrane protein YhhN